MTEVPPPASNYRRPGRPRVAQMDVDRAADALLRQGQRPSIEKLRAALGGSPNTLGPCLDDWWRRLAARVHVGAGAFERLPGSLAQIAEAFFLHAIEEARRTARREEQRERSALVREQHDVAVRSHVLSLREQELQGRLQERERTLEALELQLRDQSLMLRKMQTARDMAEQRLSELLAERTAVRRVHRRTARAPRAPTRAKTAKAVGRTKRRPPARKSPRTR